MPTEIPISDRHFNLGATTTNSTTFRLEDIQSAVETLAQPIDNGYVHYEDTPYTRVYGGVFQLDTTLIMEADKHNKEELLKQFADLQDYLLELYPDDVTKKLSIKQIYKEF